MSDGIGYAPQDLKQIRNGNGWEYHDSERVEESDRYHANQRRDQYRRDADDHAFSHPDNPLQLSAGRRLS